MLLCCSFSVAKYVSVPLLTSPEMRRKREVLFISLPHLSVSSIIKRDDGDVIEGTGTLAPVAANTSLV